MKAPAWLPKLNRQDEKLRAAYGLTAKKDGWYKSIDGKTRYICRPSSVPEVAAILQTKIDAIRSKSSRPVISASSLTIESLAELYIDWLYERLTTGRPKKLKRRTYDDNVKVIAKFVDAAGSGKTADAIGPAEFSAYAKQNFINRAQSSIRREIIYIEAFANWAAPGSRRAGYLTEKWSYGPDFTKPSDSLIVASLDDKAYTVKQVEAALKATHSSPMLCAAGWLGLNCAFGPKDIGELPESAVDIDTGTVRFARGKTGMKRMSVLWPATRLALQRYLALRPPRCEPSAEGLLFRTKNGLPYARSLAEVGQEREAARWHDGLGNRWMKVTGLPFSGLRSTFATLADDWIDQRAIDLVMGHSSRSIREAHYAKKIDPSRVSAVVEHVWVKLFGKRL